MIELTPWQDIPECRDKPDVVPCPQGNATNWTLPVESKLYGKGKRVEKITVQVDEVDPIVNCGFHDIDHFNVVENNTLFYYGWSKEPGLEDANFFYNITVRA